MKKPTRPKILRDIDDALASALGEVPGVFSFGPTGVDFAAGTNVITSIRVEAKHQRALGRWFERHMKWMKEQG